MTIKTTQEKIDELLETLQNYEDIDQHYMDADLKELRHKVMHVHLRLEISLEILIGDYLVEPYQKYQPTKDDGYMFRYHLRSVVDNMDFIKKLRVLQDAGKISKDTAGKLYRVNDIRKHFSHPLTYYDKLQEYKKQENYFKALEMLDEAYTSFNKIFAIKRALEIVQEQEEHEKKKRI